MEKFKRFLLNPMRASFKTAILYIQAILIVVTVLVVLLPEFNQIPGRDQGVYLYIGKQILDGKIPYRNVWDHKGPLIYYLNALGLLISDSVIGVWILEVILLSMTAFFSFAALKKLFQSHIAFPIVLIWLVSFQSVMDNGNTVEEYSLLFQFCAIYLFLCTTDKNPQNYWHEFFIGVTAGLTFALRPTNIGIHIAIVLAFVIFNSIKKTGYRKSINQIGMIAAGGLVVLACIAIYFWLNHAIYELWQAVFVYNYYYSFDVSPKWDKSLLKGYNFLSSIIWLSVLGFIGMLISILKQWKNAPTEFRFNLFLLIALPLQIYLSLISGRRYLHYYIAWLPVLTFFAAYFLFHSNQIIKKIIHHQLFSKFFGYTLVFVITLFMIYPVFVNRLSLIPVTSNINPPTNEITNYIQNNTSPEDYVFIWGNEVTYNFLTRRESPSRFAYIYPFAEKEYITQSMVNELITAISEKRPIIIDATLPEKYTPAIDSEKWAHIPLVQELVKFIEENYIVVDYIGQYDWPVLRPKNNE